MQTNDDVEYRIAQKNDVVKQQVMDLLHEYPNHFVHGLFEEHAERDFQEADTAVAYRAGEIVGCLMFNRQTNEYRWLAVTRSISGSKRVIAKRLFESFYPTLEPGTEVHLFVNTEDARIADAPQFSGEQFEPARKLYRSMGLELASKNRVENKYGDGAHAYRVAWIPVPLAPTSC